MEEANITGFTCNLGEVGARLNQPAELTGQQSFGVFV
jgi:hypothetical protein